VGVRESNGNLNTKACFKCGSLISRSLDRCTNCGRERRTDILVNALIGLGLAIVVAWNILWHAGF